MAPGFQQRSLSVVPSAQAYLAAGGAVQVPGKTVQYLAFPAARFPCPPAGGSGEAWRERAERVLGRRAVGVRWGFRMSSDRLRDMLAPLKLIIIQSLSWRKSY